jgi:hypothetical protein
MPGTFELFEEFLDLGPIGLFGLDLGLGGLDSPGDQEGEDECG